MFQPTGRIRSRAALEEPHRGAGKRFEVQNLNKNNFAALRQPAQIHEPSRTSPSGPSGLTAGWLNLTVVVVSSTVGRGQSAAAIKTITRAKGQPVASDSSCQRKCFQQAGSERARGSPPRLALDLKTNSRARERPLVPAANSQSAGETGPPVGVPFRLFDLTLI